MMRGRHHATVEDVRAWASPCLALVTMVALANSPSALLPLARTFRDLCDRFPILAMLTNHISPLPVAFAIVVMTFALVSGGAAGLTRLLRTRRLVTWLDCQPCAVPGRLAQVSQQLGVGERVVYLDQPVVAAFCFGVIQPRIAISAGMLARLDDDELLAVLTHERHHLLHRDPLRYLLLHSAAASAFMFPVSDVLRRRVETRMELAADRAAVALSSPAALAGALLTVLSQGEARMAGAVGLSATESRIAHLLGRESLPESPARTVLASLAPMVVIALATVHLAGSSDLVRMACLFS